MRVHNRVTILLLIRTNRSTDPSSSSSSSLSLPLSRSMKGTWIWWAVVLTTCCVQVFWSIQWNLTVGNLDSRDGERIPGGFDLFGINATSSVSLVRKRGNFSEATRYAQMLKHRDDAILKIQDLQSEFPYLNLSDLMQASTTCDDSMAHIWTPAIVESIVMARRYYYFNDTNHSATLHFLTHIPKTGGTQSAILLSRFMIRNVLGKRLKAELQRVNSTRPFQFLPCNFGNAKVESVFKKGAHFRGTACTLWIIEQRRPIDSFEYAYTLIRHPHQHIISQYFHCKESTVHQKKAEYMPPTLTDWLVAWIDIAKSKKQEVGSKVGQNPHFQCYDPRNQQTSYAEFAFAYHQNPNIPFDIAKAKAELESRFDVLGITDRTAQSTCLFAIHYTGWVPPQCDCTNYQELPTNVSLEGTSHGVQHHGSSYQTNSTEEFLLDELSRWDRVLYQIAQDIFWQRLIETEYEYGVRICDDLRTDIGPDGTRVPNRTLL